MLGDIFVGILLVVLVAITFVLGISAMMQAFYPYLPGDRRNPSLPPKKKEFLAGVFYLLCSLGSGLILWSYW